jgi:two-component system, OmpR family, response regulator
MKFRVLVVEDDASLQRVLCDNLIGEGFDVQSALDGAAAIAIAGTFDPDVVILDVMLPGSTGFDLCPVLRRGGHTPIIMLTVRDRREDKLRGLNLGADDYVTKPFDLDELIARIHAVLRRSRPTVERLALGSIVIDFRARRALNGSTSLVLTDREFEILQYLAVRQDRVVPRSELLRYVWGYPTMPQTRSVDSAIARLRRKIEVTSHHPRFIHTVHGDGYRLTPEGSDDGTLDAFERATPPTTGP